MSYPQQPSGQQYYGYYQGAQGQQQQPVPQPAGQPMQPPPVDARSPAPQPHRYQAMPYTQPGATPPMQQPTAPLQQPTAPMGQPMQPMGQPMQPMGQPMQQPVQQQGYPPVQQPYAAPPVMPASYPPQTGYIQPAQPAFSPGYTQQPAAYPQQPAAGYTPGGPPQYPMQQQPQQARTFLSPDSLPSPISIIKDPATIDEICLRNAVPITYVPSSGANIPSPYTSVKNVDDINCSTRIMSCTYGAFPASDDVVKTVNVPLAVVVQPLAMPQCGESPVPVCETPESLVRCRRCKAYMNAHNKWVEGGRKFKCCFCGVDNEISREYFCNLDPYGRRRDAMDRPELSLGSYEVNATPEFISHAPAPISFVFVIESSQQSIASGLFASVLACIKSLLTRLVVGSRVAIVTYDSSLQFYSVAGVTPQVFVMADVNEPFLPCGQTELLCCPDTQMDAIIGLIDLLPELVGTGSIGDTVPGAALEAASRVVAGDGGRILLFQTSFPSKGPGMLKNRDDSKLYGTDNEVTLLEPQKGFYDKQAEIFVNNHVSLVHYIFDHGYMDFATVRALSEGTGGHIRRFSHFVAADNESRADIDRLMWCMCEDCGVTGISDVGCDGYMRVRTSEGVSVGKKYGSFLCRNGEDLEWAGIDNSKAAVVLLQHDETLNEKITEVYVQSALLYTTSSGRRRIRVSTMMIPVAKSPQAAFLKLDIWCMMVVVARLAATLLPKKTLPVIRDYLSQNCATSLRNYRQFVTPPPPDEQLNLADSLKYYALFVLGLLKSTLFRTDQNVRPDDRAYALHCLNFLGIQQFATWYHPIIMPISDLTESVGLPHPESQLTVLPHMSRPQFEKLSNNRIYLIVDGHMCVVWIGQQVSDSELTSLWGISDINMIPTFGGGRTNVPQDPNANLHAQKVEAILQRIRMEYTGYLPVYLAKQGDQSEARIQYCMTEDKATNFASYIEYVSMIHKTIIDKLKAERSAKSTMVDMLTTFSHH